MTGDYSGDELLCPFCGASNEPDASYCIHCGNTLEEGAAGMADAAVLTPGSIIREFRIVRLVGEGGMGQVYEAKHTFTGARVAVKRMLPGLSQDPQLRQRFIWEARVMAICTHPGLVDIMQLFVEGGRFFLVMKFLEGDSAEDKVASSVDQGLLPDLREAVDIVSQVCSALQHMHDLDEEIEVPDADGRMVQRRIRGIVHRDVKPGNIMVDSAGQACLMDFGIAKAQGGETMTRVGGVVGTYEYMSPQQIQGEEVGASSDQYSLAVTLYMMLTGAVPFPQQTSGGFDAQEGHVRKPPPPPRSVRGDIPESLSNVILKALAKDPKDRFPSCRDFGAALQRAIGGEAVVPPPPPHRTVQEDWHGGVPGAGTFDDVPPPSGFPVWLLAGLGALVLVLVVVLGVMWLGGKEPAEERKSVAQTPAPIGGFKPAGGEEARRLAEEKRRLEEERRKNQEEARSLAEQRKSVEEERRRGEEEDRQRAKKQREEELEAKGLQMGVTDEGHQWVGGLNPVLEIQEFTDYECPYCRKAHLMLRKLISKYPGKIKVFHRHYPLSNKCNRAIGAEGHKRACELSAISVCAGKQGRFWEMNDFLFQHAKEIRSSKLAGIDIAKRLELDLDEFTCCMDDSATMDAIKKDVEDGIGLTLKGTPAFLIDGKVYYGKIPEEAVARISAD